MRAFTCVCASVAPRARASVSVPAGVDDTVTEGAVRKSGAQMLSSDQKNSNGRSGLSRHQNAGHFPTVTPPYIIYTLEAVVPRGFIKPLLIFTWRAELLRTQSQYGQNVIFPPLNKHSVFFNCKVT